MTPAEDSTMPAARQLFLLGFLTLFLELALIRYLPGSVWNLGYFPNLVLLAVFLGMGVGFVFHDRISSGASAKIFEGAAFGLLGLVTFIHFCHPVVPGFNQWLGIIGGELYFTAHAADSGHWDYALFGGCFLAIVGIFAAISQRTAKLFRGFAPLRSYTLDISGSCAGILSFMAISWLTLPAALWLVALIPLFYFAASTASRTRDLLLLPLAIAAGLAAVQDTRLTIQPDYRGGLEVRWSPYQKVELSEGPESRAFIFVNGIGHQTILTAADLPSSFYAVPYTVRRNQPVPRPCRNVLVLGAGSGNDVAAALANGCAHIDAVEIDPVIAAFGRRFNPTRPYADPRVSVIVDDGRAFMTRTNRRYDLIVFALTDSLVRVSSMAQLRLENYLFTRESLQRAYSLLEARGDIVLYNYYRRPWLAEKLQRMIFAATGKYAAQVYKVDDFGMFMVGAETQAASAPAFVDPNIDVTVDDWPFPYLRARGLPALYRGLIASVVALIGVLMAGWYALTPRERRPVGSLRVKVAFAFMGAAFLLLETKSVVQFSLLFGTTWINSSIVFLSVLLLVLAANWTASVLKPSSLLFAYALLVLSCLATFVYPLSRLLVVDSFLLRCLFAGLLTFLPIFFANLIFSLTFQRQPAPEHLFGWNLIGAALGGVAEYSSLAFGYAALAIVVTLCYTAVVLLLRIKESPLSQTAPTASAH